MLLIYREYDNTPLYYRVKLLISYFIFLCFTFLKINNEMFYLAFLTNNIFCKCMFIPHIEQQKLKFLYYLTTIIFDLMFISLIFHYDISKFLSLYTVFLFVVQLSS